MCVFFGKVLRRRAWFAGALLLSQTHSNSLTQTHIHTFTHTQKKGLKTSEDAKFYALSTKFDKFSNKGEPLVVQFSVKHEQNIDCGGGYVKLFPSTQDQTAVNGDSPYNIMFGPDICGPGTRKVGLCVNVC